jgi:hypothetical protein
LICIRRLDYQSEGIIIIIIIIIITILKLDLNLTFPDSRDNAAGILNVLKRVAIGAVA